MLKPKTYKDLLEEKRKLETLLVVQKDIIKNDLSIVNGKLAPALELISKVGGITTLTRSNPLLTSVLSLGGEFLLKDVLLSRSSKVTRFVVTYLLKNVAALVFNKKRLAKKQIEKNPHPADGNFDLHRN